MRLALVSRKPPDCEGMAHRSLLQSFLRQLRWLFFGVPKGRPRGRWVYNSSDGVWRYYVNDIEDR